MHPYLRENFADDHLLEGDWLWRAGGKCFDERRPDARHVSARLYEGHHAAHVSVALTTDDVRRRTLRRPTPLCWSPAVRRLADVAETTTTIPPTKPSHIYYTSCDSCLSACKLLSITTIHIHIRFGQENYHSRSHRPPLFTLTYDLDLRPRPTGCANKKTIP